MDNNPDLLARGDPAIGLAGFNRLTNVFRAGDPDAGGNLTVDTWDIPSYPQNTFPQPGGTPQLIMSFEIAVPEPATIVLLTAGAIGLLATRRRMHKPA